MADDEVLTSISENIEATTPPSKGIKRNAVSPPEGEVKKPKVVNSDDDEQKEESVEVIEEVAGTPTAPKTPKTPKTTKEEREKLRLQKLEEKEKQRAEREKALEEKRLEKEKQLEEKRLEKEKKEKERLEKKAEEERKKEEKRKEVEEKKKEEEEKKRKKKEEEEKRKKEEDEKKEQKRKEEEALEEKKRRESARFMGFFSKVEKKKVATEEQKNVDNNWYRPFQLKDGMSLAPILGRDPVVCDANEILNCSDEVTSTTYLGSGNVKNHAMNPPKRAQACYKLLQFHDNRRPPYYGTFRKRPQKISGRKPWSPIEPGIDYEVDSDDEWEDEPSDGEECRSDDEEEADDDVMSDDGFFVPPCYLSDGEGDEEAKSNEPPQNGGEEEEKEEEKRGEESEEERKARLASRAKEWSRRVTRGGHIQLESRCIGPFYYYQRELQEAGSSAAALEELSKLMAVQFF
ncbi:unnamed protein product [Caenorhabditis angaria]|uniref:Chromatin assembly factor 1 subunit A dimerization domain-containing protein n=1 Tax=Caenorhabditis angaria TaxID=860376 RepID=A0A9P1I414_9PELO|nr:unnamed protein product [Caenorhabditis angaria]